MNDPPFGFGLPPGGEDPKRRDSGSDNPFAGLFGGDPAAIGAAFQQLGQLLSYSGGPVNWDLARDVARQTISAAGDRSVADAQRRGVEEAVRLAELWLDPVTTIP